MNIKKIALSLALLAMIGTTGAAQATCLFSGEVQQVYTTTGNSSYVYISAPGSFVLQPYVYYFRTSDAGLTSALNSSVHKTIQIVGDAASCPTTGAYRYGGIVSYINVG